MLLILSSFFRFIQKCFRWVKDRLSQLRDYIHRVLWGILQSRIRELTRRRDKRESTGTMMFAVEGFSVGQVTHQSAMALPGMTRSFLAKEEASVAGMGGMPAFFPRAAMSSRKRTAGYM